MAGLGEQLGHDGGAARLEGLGRRALGQPELGLPVVDEGEGGVRVELAEQPVGADVDPRQLGALSRDQGVPQRVLGIPRPAARQQFVLDRLEAAVRHIEGPGHAPARRAVEQEDRHRLRRLPAQQMDVAVVEPRAVALGDRGRLRHPVAVEHGPGREQVARDLSVEDAPVRDELGPVGEDAEDDRAVVLTA